MTLHFWLREALWAQRFYPHGSKNTFQVFQVLLNLVERLSHIFPWMLYLVGKWCRAPTDRWSFWSWIPQCADGGDSQSPMRGGSLVLLASLTLCCWLWGWESLWRRQFHSDLTGGLQVYEGEWGKRNQLPVWEAQIHLSHPFQMNSLFLHNILWWNCSLTQNPTDSEVAEDHRQSVQPNTAVARLLRLALISGALIGLSEEPTKPGLCSLSLSLLL